MSLLFLGLFALICGSVGWILGAASARRKLRPISQWPSAKIATPDEYQLERPSISGPPHQTFDLVESHADESPVIESAASDLSRSSQIGEIDDALKALVDSLHGGEVLTKTHENQSGHIRHLLVTRNGDRWVVDRLPKDDYADVDDSVQSVDQLISKPAGYRLIKGYNMLKEDDTEEGGDS